MGLPKIQGEVGKVWGEVELRFTPGGKAVAMVPLVFTKRVKNQQTNEWEDKGTLWVRGQAWEQFAENLAESLSKGDEVIVTGELSSREYEAKDGSKRSSLELAIYAIGPNLKWVTAKVSRADRNGPSKTQEPDPWGSAPAKSSSFNDEPPF